MATIRDFLVKEEVAIQAGGPGSGRRPEGGRAQRKDDIFRVQRNTGLKTGVHKVLTALGYQRSYTGDTTGVRTYSHPEGHKATFFQAGNQGNLHVSAVQTRKDNGPEEHLGDVEMGLDESGLLGRR